MLNYIWAGLIVVSLLFAAIYDTRDLLQDTYRNGDDLDLSLSFEDRYDSDARRQTVTVKIERDQFTSHYEASATEDLLFDGILVRTEKGIQVRFAADVPLPKPLDTIREMTSARDNDLRGTVSAFRLISDSTATLAVTFAPVRFVKMQAISDAALSLAETAVSLALGLIGVIALFMGLLQIAEKSGLIHLLVRLTQPLLKPLFPDIPKDHPALGMIVLNLSANVLGLGNAATPLGIKAMEELQELSPEKETATDSMVMLLAMNTASVQLVPPVLLVALMGLQVNQLMFAIFIVTTISLTVAVISAKLLGKMKRYRETNPNRQEKNPEGA
ncbi:MAG: nucleoside recognition domain-containing protein [Rhodothermia bacterium]|nr:MAG: nucleoside recognition domain-containing protein [Rhodothermia bacterium]